MTGFNPQMKLSLIHHDDVDQAFMLAATTANLNDSNPIFNVVDEEPLTVVDLLKLVGAQPQPTSELSSAALETGEYEMALDNTKIKNKLGFKPIFPNFYTAQNADRL
ncbi:hypothetical protein [Loigolactobacillus backii]|nr:hypothetical protein [Loigolactobacillus backii]